MPIKPFRDTAKIDMAREHSTTQPKSGVKSTMSLSGTMDTVRQGVSIRSYRQFHNRVLVRISSQDAPFYTDEPIIPYLEVSNYGQPKLFNDPSPDGETSPFEDMVGKFVARDYILDEEGTQIYPTILLNPTLRDPAQLDGVIEPFGVRSALGDISEDTPFSARSIKGGLMSGFRGHSGKGAEIISQIVYFYNPVSSSIDMTESDYFEDNQEKVLNNIPAPGFISNYMAKNRPFDDSQRLTHVSSSFSFLSGGFRDRGDFGTTFKSAPSGFTFNHSNVGNTDNEEGRVSSTVLGTDSIAFGGLKK